MISLNQRVILIPIVLAALVHLWNTGGFPPLHPDETAYMIKTMRVLAGYGPQNKFFNLDNYYWLHPWDGLGITLSS